VSIDYAHYYKKQAVETASPARLIIMLYEGALNSIAQAKQALRDGRIPQAHENIVKAQDIISELDRSVDTSYEVGKSLAALYDYMLRHLITANVKKDEEVLREVEEMLQELLAAWQEAARKAAAASVSGVGGYAARG